MQLIDKLGKQTKLIIACVAVVIALLITFGVLPVVDDTGPYSVTGLFVFALFLSGFDYMDNKEAVKALIAYVQAIQFSPALKPYIDAGIKTMEDLDKKVASAEMPNPPTAG